MTVTFRRLLVHWRSLVVVLLPLILSPLVVSGSKEGKCGFVVVLMSVYWMTEAVPLAVTSFLPVFLFPLLDVLDTEKVCNAYLKETNMMFIGGLIVAIAVEHCNLHKRIALKVILTIGTSPVRLLLGFMITTMSLSMWISNTATTAMMTPIVKAVLDELKANKDEERRRRTSSLNIADSEHASGAFDPETRRKSVYLNEFVNDERPEKTDICYYLGVAYASNLGGAGTLTGTGTNLTFKGIWDATFPKAGGVNFASWMIFGTPIMLINMLASWLWLQFLFMGLFRKKEENKKFKTSSDDSKIVREVIEIKYKELGPMSFHEGSVLFLFIIVVFLWFFRQPEFMPGWAQIISSVDIGDATPVMLIVFLLFVLPANLDFLRFSSNERRPVKAAPALLTWKVVHEKVPWGLVCLLGGGFAMAAASNESGLSNYIGQELVYLNVLPPYLILIIIATATTFLTEVSSNTAVANIILPVLAHMAVAMQVHPLYFMIPATLCCSYAFMLPVATPPNAIVLAASNMRTTDMMKAGVGMNVICLIILCTLYLTYGSYVYDLNNFDPRLFGEEAKCAYVVLIMATYWVTEALPLPVTALIPVFLFPLLEILPTEKICITYMKEVNMMFLGGIFLALAVEHCNLHDRIALEVILIVGTSPVRLMLGLMLTTMFLSMWISNTAGTAMMTPIVRAVLDELKAGDAQRRKSISPLSLLAEDMELYGSQIRERQRSSFYLEEEEHADKLDVCLYLSIAYAANVGGTGTLTGTGTNLIFKGIYDELYPHARGVTYASWMLFCVPVVLMIVFGAWIWLQVLYMGLFRENSPYRKLYKSKSTKERAAKVREIIHTRFKHQGQLTFHQKGVLVIFVCVVILWFFREPEFMPGWADYTSVNIKDATPVMLGVFLLHVIPSNLDFLRVRTERDMTSAPGLLTWKVVQERTPWGVFILLGGGFAMAAACEESGLSTFLGDILQNLEILPAPVILIVITVFTKCLNEVGSNTAIANIILPVLSKMSTGMDMHPMYLMLPATLCCSFSFMLPASTPPNAIIQAACNLKTSEMMKAGIMMHLISLVVLLGCFLSFGVYIYDIPNYNKTDFASNKSAMTRQTFLNISNAIV